ncbi:hypothetical protein BpHYR1_041479 [Brachionus plicatilis]|uniref:Uncharacterized protein n=1 Tax=Brachionus plicatilis TaxID=10195 RepID=A0A3M7RWA4_BRAPC|nr:hypothetical protein BpHYR1_041479 [Brachionus plicatilis]
MGMNVAEFIGWYVSAPHLSHVYVATWSSGLMSPARITTPFTQTRLPIERAFIWRTETDLVLGAALKWSSKRRRSSLGNVLRGGRGVSAE